MPLSIPDLSQFSDEQLRELLAAIPVELSKRIGVSGFSGGREPLK